MYVTQYNIASLFVRARGGGKRKRGSRRRETDGPFQFGLHFPLRYGGMEDLAYSHLSMLKRLVSLMVACHIVSSQ